MYTHWDAKQYCELYQNGCFHKTTCGEDKCHQTTRGYSIVSRQRGAIQVSADNEGLLKCQQTTRGYSSVTRRGATQVSPDNEGLLKCHQTTRGYSSVIRQRGATQVSRKARGVEATQISADLRYEEVQFNTVTITKRWLSIFQKKCSVTLECPQNYC